MFIKEIGFKFIPNGFLSLLQPRLLKFSDLASLFEPATYFLSFWDILFSRGCFVLLGESGLVGQGVTIIIERFPVQALLGAQPGLRTQPRYEAPIVEM